MWMIGRSTQIIVDTRNLTTLSNGSGRYDTVYMRHVTMVVSMRSSLQCVRTWNNETKSRFLQFATGTSRIPVNGFKDLQGSDGPRRFTIEKAGEVAQLPKSHTWYVILKG